MKGIFHTSWVVGGLFILSLLAGCSEDNSNKGLRVALPRHLFQDGDIAFRRGTGIASRVVLTADKQGAYSHTGILKKHAGRWFVIHAVPGEPEFEGDVDKVKMEAIERFFERQKAVRGAIMRISKDSTIAKKVAENAFGLFKKRVLFDHNYDLNDTTQLYCTELVDYVYRKEGIDLPEGRISTIHIPGIKGNYLLPNDIAQNKRLSMVYYF